VAVRSDDRESLDARVVLEKTHFDTGDPDANQSPRRNPFGIAKMQRRVGRASGFSREFSATAPDLWNRRVDLAAACST
jgi:hypothetical protein